MIDEKKQKKQLSAISNFRNKNEKASWMRKKRNLETLVEEISLLEDDLRAITQQKQEIIDKINVIRDEMIVECIHPLDYLVHHGTYVICRFCETKLRMVE